MTKFKVGDIVKSYNNPDAIYRIVRVYNNLIDIKAFSDYYIFKGFSTILFRKATKEDFYNTKIKVDTPEKSKRVQEYMFSLGFNGPTVEFTNKKYLFLWDSADIGYSESEDYFNNNTKKEIKYEDMFEEEQPKNIFSVTSYVADYIEEEEENTMETKYDQDLGVLENFNKDNLKEAKKLAIQEKNNYEVQLAKAKYEELINLKERHERTIKEYQEYLKQVNGKLKLFK